MRRVREEGYGGRENVWVEFDELEKGVTDGGSYGRWGRIREDKRE
jgi:hypothetical protein